VEDLRRLKRIRYRLLLGGASEREPCPVLTQFAVRGFPTLVLLDEQGRIIWRGDGALTRETLQDLHLQIRQHLRPQ